MQRKKSLIRPERSRSIKRIPATSGTASGAGNRSNADFEPLGRLRTEKSSLGRSDTLIRAQLGQRHQIIQSSNSSNWWTRTSRCLTFYAPFVLLEKCSKAKQDRQVLQAFREKLALCTIIGILMTFVAFITFGLRAKICIQPARTFPYATLSSNSDVIAISGLTYILPPNYTHPAVTGASITRNLIGGRDLTFLFPLGNPHCDAIGVDKNPFQCDFPGVWPLANPGAGAPTYACHTIAQYNQITQFRAAGLTYFPWADIQTKVQDPDQKQQLIVYNGHVLDVTKYPELPGFLGSLMYNLTMANIGQDMTFLISQQGLQAQAKCLSDVFKIAFVDSSSAGCFVSNIVLYVSLAFIGGVVVTRFAIALFFGLFLGWRLGDQDKELLNAVSSNKAIGKKFDTERKSKSRFTPKTQHDIRQIQPGSSGSNMSLGRPGSLQVYQHQTNATLSSNPSLDIAFMDINNPTLDPIMNDPKLMHTLVMVPCYSEDMHSMRTTIQSIVDSDYPATHKCIFVIADGIVQGSGNAKPTHEFVIDMMDIDHRFSREDPANGGVPASHSYVAIADGRKRKNFAKVYAGWYKTTKLPMSSSSETLVPGEEVEENMNDSRGTGAGDNVSGDEDLTGTQYTIRERRNGRVPMILVVKVGNEEEQVPGQTKPGNRGKRDSQVILMNFLSKVMFDDRMTELEFDIFFKLYTITGIIPEKYEAVMMVDADTKIFTSALRHLIAAMIKDTDIIGICGETRVGNKWGSWVTMIQVFEYHISHNLAKAFETVFGVVTCLPGCFSVYRVSAPKGAGFCVPILANPDIVEEYSENVVDTLHKKNLLLLGEDRYLSTLLLKAFPKRKMAYIPNAICETVVPDQFGVLLSQRRRWINSTIHNLLELIQVRNLCGIFCFSMQFVIFMELLGTVVLPAAICFTIYVLVLCFTTVNPPIVTLVLLGAILGLPGLLTVFTTGKVTHLFWMIIYLLALPIWNFVLPLYAFWHFDDFSWGDTRVVEGELKGDVHGKREGEFDGSGISMKRWEDWMTERKALLSAHTNNPGNNSGSYIVELPPVAPLTGRLNAALPKKTSNNSLSSYNTVPVFSGAAALPPSNSNQFISGPPVPFTSARPQPRPYYMKTLPNTNQRGGMTAPLNDMPRQPPNHQRPNPYYNNGHPPPNMQQLRAQPLPVSGQQLMQNRPPVIIIRPPVNGMTQQVPNGPLRNKQLPHYPNNPGPSMGRPPLHFSVSNPNKNEQKK